MNEWNIKWTKWINEVLQWTSSLRWTRTNELIHIIKLQVPSPVESSSQAFSAHFEPLCVNMYHTSLSDGAVSHYALRLEIYGANSYVLEGKNDQKSIKFCSFFSENSEFFYSVSCRFYELLQNEVVQISIKFKLQFFCRHKFTIWLNFQEILSHLISSDSDAKFGRIQRI